LDEEEPRFPDEEAVTRRFQMSETAYYSAEGQEEEIRRPQKSGTACYPTTDRQETTQPRKERRE
jgi:hypothetical protein